MAMFPDEILLNILGHLEDEYNQDDNDSTIIKHVLLDLCRSSKLFCIAAQPILHSKFSRTNDEMDQYTEDDHLPATRYRRFRRTTRTENFLRTLIHRSDLAANVKFIRLHAFQNGNRPKSFDSEYLPLDPIMTMLMSDASQRIPPPEPPMMFRVVPVDSKTEDKHSILKWQDKWRSALRRGAPNAEIALLLALLPNVSLLHLSSSDYDLGEYVDNLCEQMLGPLSRKRVNHHGLELKVDSDWRSQSCTPIGILPNLKELRVATQHNWSNLTFEGIKCLITIPTLRRLSCTNLDATPRHTDQRFFHHPLGHIESLQLDECTFTVEALSELIEACTGLKHLDIQFSWSDPINLGGIFWRNLNERAQTLETLQLQKYDHSGMTLRDRIKLTQFAKLSSLAIEQGLAFVIPDSLPTSLEKLLINKCDEQIAPLVDRLEQAVMIKRLPNLRELSVMVEFSRVDDELKPDLLDKFHRLEDSFRDKNVEFRLVPEPVLDGTV